MDQRPSQVRNLGSSADLDASFAGNSSYLRAIPRLFRGMESNFLARSRPSEPLAHLLVAALAAITVAGVVGSLLGVQHASTLLYWPVALVVAAVAFSFRPGHVHRTCE